MCALFGQRSTGRSCAWKEQLALHGGVFHATVTVLNTGTSFLNGCLLCPDLCMSLNVHHPSLKYNCSKKTVGVKSNDIRNLSVPDQDCLEVIYDILRPLCM